MKPKITLKSIANEFGVSISTVSKALKDSNEIGEETKSKIQAYAKFYNYKPNSLALHFRSQRVQVIGVLVPEIVHHFFSTVIKGVEEYASQKGYSTIVCLSNESYEKEVSQTGLLADGSVDGLLVSISRETFRKNDFSHFEALLKDDFPLVLFDRVTDTINCDKVTIDDVQGGYEATKHLLDVGRKNILLLTTQDSFTITELREKGYRKALKEFHTSNSKSTICKIDDEKDLYSQIEKVIQENPMIDAVLAVNEVYAANVLKAVETLKKEVPKDIAVIGFTNGAISQFTSPALTAVEQHGYTMGQKAAKVLIERIESKVINPFKEEVIQPTLKVRESAF